jgi:hypothetical protein
MSMLARGRLRLREYRTMPMQDAGEAHRLLGSGHVHERIVLALWSRFWAPSSPAEAGISNGQPAPLDAAKPKSPVPVWRAASPSDAVGGLPAQP